MGKKKDGNFSLLFEPCKLFPPLYLEFLITSFYGWTLDFISWVRNFCDYSKDTYVNGGREMADAADANSHILAFVPF